MDEDDRQWAIEQLEQWVRTAQAYESSATAGPEQRKALAQKLMTDQAVVRRIIHRLQPGYSRDLIIAAPNLWWVVNATQGVMVCRWAVGELQTQAEAVRRLGTSAPRMSADALHPTVWGAASKLWEDGHHGPAVQRAATFLSAHVQDLVGRHDVSDGSLMQQVFSERPPEADRARLRWPGDDSDQTVRSMREGLRGFGPGCFHTIRNPATHLTEDPPRQQCLESLAALSLLARWIDGCEVLRAST